MTNLNYAPIFINQYLAEKIPASIPNRFSGSLLFFPVSPTDINALTETFPEAANNVFAVYDRMFRMRHKAFPHIKSEQLLYYFYKMAGDPEALIETTQVIYDLLDREDESAEEINTWIRSKLVNGVLTIDGKDFKPIYFHKLKVYQLQETRDIVNFATARTYAGNKIIVDYDYHQL
jgi:hypothetical protein